MTATATATDHAASGTLDPLQLRDDLLVLRRIIGHGRAAPASVARNLNMARHIAQHWAPFGHTRCAAADGSGSEEQRWEILLACADPDRSVERSHAGVMVYACAVRELVQALHDVARPGAAVPEVSRAPGDSQRDAARHRSAPRLQGTPMTTDRYTAATATHTQPAPTQVETVLARLVPRCVRRAKTNADLQAIREAALASAINRTPRPRIGIYTMVQAHQDPAVRLAVARGLAVRNGWLLERAPAVDFTGMTNPATRPQLARLLDALDRDDIDGIAATSRTDFSDLNGDYEDALQRIHARRGFLALASTETDI
ncbi:hypothetical protein [Streptomyces sp. bgisy084]|uniref:hypothetical protein n=1 Tax=unclassified Streptomyces TaxID=2593676 RepID=UPI003D734116